MKYINADKLITEIKRLEEMDYHCDTFEQSVGFYEALDYIKSFLNSLQQEQPEVDLKKEIEEHADTMPMCEFTHDSEVEDYLDWARTEFRHFYELGLKARKEE